MSGRIGGENGGQDLSRKNGALAESNVRAMVVEEFGKPLRYREFELPEPQNGEVLVKIIASGICGSDVHVWKGEDKRSRLPMILGHEGLGIVGKIMAGRMDIFQNELSEGDLIIWNRGVSCKACYQCLIKRKTYNCTSRWTYGFSKSINDYPYLNGSYSSHMLLTPETEIIRIRKAEEVKPEEDYVPYVSACCAGTTTACVFEQIRIDPADHVVIQGPGPLGIYAVLFAKEAGAQNIIVIGGTKERLDLCRKAGATHIIDRSQTTEEERLRQVMAFTDGRGGDVVLELAGTKEAVEEGIKFTSVNGTYASAGIAVDVGDVKINWFRDVVRKNVTVKGVWVGDVKNTYQAMKIYEKHKDLLAEMISHRIPLKEADQALQLMEEKKTVKAVLIP